MPAPLFMKTKQFAELLGVTQETVRAQCKAGKVPGAKRFGAAWLIPIDFAEGYMSPVVDKKPREKPETLEIVDGSEPAIFSEIKKRVRAK